jgi:choline dehydrogenase-like flavoprotein
VNAKCGTHNTVIPQAMATGHCEVRTGCVVSEIVVDDRGRARGVEYFDRQNRREHQAADIVVTAASATETARLLLNSKSKLFPQGAGNRRDWVGRNFQGHAYTGAWGLFAEDVYDDVGAGATIAICDFNHGNSGFTGGAMLANEFIRLPYLFTGTRPPGAASWGKAHKDFQRQYYKRCLRVVGPVQEMPVFDSRVEVDAAVKDFWGIPVARISGRRHPHDLRLSQFIAGKAEQWLKQTGAITTWPTLPGGGVSGGQHQAGTCRMGHDPATSVTNKYGQVHDIDNLFVADGSLMVTNGGFNPVLTIMALAYWVSDYIKREWRGSRFKS